MTPETADLVRRLALALAKEDGLLPESGSVMLEWQASGSIMVEAGGPGDVWIAASFFSASIDRMGDAVEVGAQG